MCWPLWWAIWKGVCLLLPVVKEDRGLFDSLLQSCLKEKETSLKFPVLMEHPSSPAPSVTCVVFLMQIGKSLWHLVVTLGNRPQIISLWDCSRSRYGLKLVWMHYIGGDAEQQSNNITSAEDKMLTTCSETLCRPDLEITLGFCSNRLQTQKTLVFNDFVILHCTTVALKSISHKQIYFSQKH